MIRLNWFVAAFLLGAVPARADLPPAPLSSTATVTQETLSLDELGFSAAQTVANPELQAKLDRRSWMLKTHQILALATVVPMLMTIGSGPGDDGDERGGARRLPSRSSVRWHEAAGISTTALYLAAASFAIFAPNPEHPPARGASRVHRWLALIHAPLMILTPTLGLLADQRLKRGESPGTYGSLHRLAVGGLVVSYGAAATIMVIKF